MDGDWDLDPTREVDVSGWDDSLPPGQLRSRPLWHYLVAGGVAVVVVTGLFLFLPIGGSDEDVAQEGTDVVVLGETTLPAPEPDVQTPLVPEVTGAPTVEQTGQPQVCVGGSAVANPIQVFLDAAVSQQGDPYEFGVEVDSTDPNPGSFDTSELVEWSAAQAGVAITDGSWLQYLDLEACGGATTVEQALALPGALVFGFSSEPTADARPDDAFVAISLGDGRIVDVTPAGGVEIQPATSRPLTHAAIIPDLGQAQLAVATATP